MDFPDLKYRQLCSEVTLHDRYGFFLDLVHKAADDVGAAWVDKVFAKALLDKDKILACCRDKRVWDLLKNLLKNIQPFYRKKSGKGSQEARLQGDKAMKEGLFQKATMLYSQSVIKAPPTNEDPDVDDGLSLVKALRARASAHNMMHKFEACIADLHLCLEEGYPIPLRYQIYRAMGEAYFDMKESKRAQISWQLALKLLDEQISRVDEGTPGKRSKKDKIVNPKLRTQLHKERKEIVELINSKRSVSLSIGETLPPQTYCGVAEVVGSVHCQYPNASSLVSIKRTLEQGRFAVASDDISTGATLVVEEPYASVLIVDKFGSNCHHCYARLYSPVPCRTCSGLAFCSSACRAKATYHQYECEYSGLLHGAGISALAHLSLRILTQEGFHFFKTLQQKIENVNKEKMELSEREEQYVHVYGLTTNQDRRCNDDFFHRAVMAIFLVSCLKGTHFFPPSTQSTPASQQSDGFSDDEILAASLILRHLQVLQFNAHEIYETRTTAHGKTKGSKAIYIAVGIYPTVALFNHECAPAVVRYFHGKKIVIRTIRPLKKGEVISENYGPIYLKRSTTERHRDLSSRYWFTCSCIACKENWPNLEQLANLPPKLRCPTTQCRNTFPLPENLSLRPKCSSCSNRISLKEIWTQVSHSHTLYDRGIKHLEDDKPDLAQQLLAAYLDKVYDTSPPPNREIALAQQALRSCYAQSGNLWIVS